MNSESTEKIRQMKKNSENLDEQAEKEHIMLRFQLNAIMEFPD